MCVFWTVTILWTPHFTSLNHWLYNTNIKYQLNENHLLQSYIFIVDVITHRSKYFMANASRTWHIRLVHLDLYQVSFYLGSYRKTFNTLKFDRWYKCLYIAQLTIIHLKRLSQHKHMMTHKQYVVTFTAAVIIRCWLVGWLEGFVSTSLS